MPEPKCLWIAHESPASSEPAANQKGAELRRRGRVGAGNKRGSVRLVSLSVFWKNPTAAIKGRTYTSPSY